MATLTLYDRLTGAEKCGSDLTGLDSQAGARLRIAVRGTQCQCSDSHNPSSTPISSSPGKNTHHLFRIPMTTNHGLRCSNTRSPVCTDEEHEQPEHNMDELPAPSSSVSRCELTFTL
ncbi:unnamed protein product, partial [Pleuronectes platessa]